MSWDAGANPRYLLAGEQLSHERSYTVSTEDIINAWRDEEYRDSLDEELRAALPESPVGAIDLSEEELEGVEGGTDTDVLTAVTAILTVIGSGSCSIIDGGTCEGDTTGCC